MKKIKWPKTVKFDKHAPAVAAAVVMSAPDGDMNRAETQRGIKWLRDRGCDCKLSEHFYGNCGFLAGTPEEVAADINEAARDQDVDWIISGGGGYNGNALLPYLDYAAIANAGKPIVGLSNPTVLLNAITAKTGLVAYSGPVLIHNLGNEQGIDSFTESHFREMLEGGKPQITIKAEPEWTWLRKGTVEGCLFGGNIWSLEHLLGTPYEPNWKNAILFIEDCFCELHAIYAALEHFKAAGVFDKIGGLIIGIPLEVAETELPYKGTFNDVVMDVVRDFKFPVLANVHLGHTDRKLTMPIGAKCHLDSSRNAIVFERS